MILGIFSCQKGLIAFALGFVCKHKKALELIFSSLVEVIQMKNLQFLVNTVILVFVFCLLDKDRFQKLKNLQQKRTYKPHNKDIHEVNEKNEKVDQRVRRVEETVHHTF